LFLLFLSPPHEETKNRNLVIKPIQSRKKRKHPEWKALLQTQTAIQLCTLKCIQPDPKSSRPLEPAPPPHQIKNNNPMK
jgi:hypothetical protein